MSCIECTDAVQLKQNHHKTIVKSFVRKTARYVYPNIKIMNEHENIYERICRIGMVWKYFLYNVGIMGTISFYKIFRLVIPLFPKLEQFNNKKKTKF